MTFEPRLHIHVAADGDDSGPGSVAQPFATLHRAQQAVRERTAEMDRDMRLSHKATSSELVSTP